MSRIAIIISNYNMPEAVDSLVAFFERTVTLPHEIIVVDNGSDMIEPSRHTTLAWKENLGPAASWHIVKPYLKRLEKKREQPFFAHLFCITSLGIPAEQTTDIVGPMVKVLNENPSAVFVHPSHAPQSGVPFRFMLSRGKGIRPVRFAEFVAGLVRADWFESVGGFDEKFFQSWGLDIDLCCKALLSGRTAWIHDEIQVLKLQDNGYRMGRFHLSAEKRTELADRDMKRILTEKYGTLWQLLRDHPESHNLTEKNIEEYDSYRRQLEHPLPTAPIGRTAGNSTESSPASQPS